MVIIETPFPLVGYTAVGDVVDHARTDRTPASHRDASHRDISQQWRVDGSHKEAARR